ncbi:MAG: diguanylate cyclase [Pseudomonadota bacterium]
MTMPKNPTEPNPIQESNIPQIPAAVDPVALRSKGLVLVMIRLTLAMEGISPELDPLVKALRNRLRQGALDADGVAALDQLSNDLLRTRQQMLQARPDAPPWEQAVCRSFVTLLELAPEKSAEFLTICARLVDQPRAVRLEALRQFFFSTLDAHPASTQVSRTEKTEVPGFFTRFFARSQATQALPANMNTAVLALLQGIPWPEVWKQNLEQFCRRLQESQRDDEWKQILESLGELITQVVSTIEHEVHDTEEFLTHLFSHIQMLAGFFVDVREDSLESLKSSLDLNQFFLAEAGHIASSFVKQADPQQVQRTIAGRLDAIRRKLVTHVDAARERMNRAEARKQELQQQLEKVETEASDLRRQIVQVRQQALRDALTGLPNRLAYQERLDQEFKRWSRFKESLVVIVWDVDDFKSVNDRFGHHVGDKALRAIAEVLWKRLRQTDFMARYGGEEFVALLVGSDLAQAQEVAGDMRKAVEETRFYTDERRIPLTISCGISQFIEGDTPEQVFARADQALYQAKRSGKNRCVTAS